MRIVTTFPMLTLLVVTGASGCRTTIQNYPVGAANFASASKGVPWVEPRQYDVYVYQGAGSPTPPATNATQIYYGRHYLLDEVSGKLIDTGRPRWQTNYKAWLFADGTIILSFDEYGSLKKAEVTSTTGLPEVARAGAAVAETPESIEKEKLERLERELKILETTKKIQEARDALQD